MLNWQTESVTPDTERTILKINSRTELQTQFLRTWRQNHGTTRLFRDHEGLEMERSHNPINMTVATAVNIEGLRQRYRREMEEATVKLEVMEIIKCQMEHPELDNPGDKNNKPCKNCPHAAKCEFYNKTGELTMVFLREDLREEYTLSDVVREAMYQFDITPKPDMEAPVKNRLKLACKTSLKDMANENGKYPRDKVFDLLHNSMWLYFATLALELKSQDGENA